MFYALIEPMSAVNEKNEDYNFIQLKLIVVNYFKMMSL